MRVTKGMMRRRLVLTLLALLGAIGALIGRLSYIQVIQEPWLSGQAQEQQSRDIEVKGVRGSILDDDGNVLVYSASSASLMVVPAQIKGQALKETVAKALSKILNMPYEKILTMVSKRERAVYIQPQGRRISDNQLAQVEVADLPGIYVTQEGKRAYPYGDLAAQVLGITGSDNQGITGVELQYNKQLEGGKGYIKFYANVKGEKMPGVGETYVPPSDGDDVELTLNTEIQQFVQREIEAAVAEYKPDHVTAIVEQPSTGAILAMANYPTFQPADWKNYPASTYNRNLAIWQTFEPGSTFKVVTLSAALQENKVNFKDSFYDPGYYEVAGHKIRCWKKGGHGSENFLNVVENSCNPGFMLMGERLGKETLFSYIRKFGFGSKTGIDLPGEGNGILFKLNKVGPLELATTAFGQGVSVTPIQQVMAIGAVANGGKLMKPYVVSEIKDHDTGAILSKTQPAFVRQVISPAVAAQVRGAMESVVANGSGGGAYSEGYRVGGKTGTAQVAANGHYESGHYIVSFIGMAPVNNPQLVAYIAIDYPRPPAGKPVFGGVIAAPIVGRILNDSLNYLDVPKQTGGIPKKLKWPNVSPVQVTNFIGMTLSQASQVTLQSDAQLKTLVSGKGKYIVAQAPQAGTSVEPGSTVRFFLGDTLPPGVTPPTSVKKN